MDTIPPVVADAYDLLQADLYHHLDEAEFVAGSVRRWTDQDLDTARELISDLVLVVRGLLIKHEIQPSGHCPTCASPWPCPVITAIHGPLKDPKLQFVALVKRARDAQ